MIGPCSMRRSFGRTNWALGIVRRARAVRRTLARNIRSLPFTPVRGASSFGWTTSKSHGRRTLAGTTGVNCMGSAWGRTKWALRIVRWAKAVRALLHFAEPTPTVMHLHIPFHALTILLEFDPLQFKVELS